MRATFRLVPPRRPELRDQIVREARKLARRGGLESLTMRNLAAHVGLTAPALYRHFPSKAALVQRLVDEANVELGARLQKALERGTGLARVRAACDAYLEFALARPADYEVLFFSSVRRDLEVPPSGERSPNFRFFRERVAEAMASGELRAREPAVVAFVLWAWLHGLVALGKQGRLGDSKAALRVALDEGFRIYLEGLKPTSP